MSFISGLSNAFTNAKIFSADKKAVTAIEYALIAALIAVVIIIAVSTLGNNVSSTFNTIATDV